MWRGGGARWSALVAVALAAAVAVARRDPKGGPSDISLWMDEKQVRMFSGKRQYHSIIYTVLVARPPGLENLAEPELGSNKTKKKIFCS